jgi:hypothetical protein
VCTVLRAVAADFLFNCWCVEIPSDNRIGHVPRCVHYHAQGLGSVLGFLCRKWKPSPESCPENIQHTYRLLVLRIPCEVWLDGTELVYCADLMKTVACRLQSRALLALYCIAGCCRTARHYSLCMWLCVLHLSPL